MSEIDRAMLQSMAASFRGALDFSFNRHDMADLMDSCASRTDLAQASVAAALESALTACEHVRDFCTDHGDEIGYDNIATGAHVAAEVAKARADIYAQIEAMPRREEMLGGQRTQYVQLHEVLAWIGAKP